MWNDDDDNDDGYTVVKLQRLEYVLELLVLVCSAPAKEYIYIYFFFSMTAVAAMQSHTSGGPEKRGGWRAISTKAAIEKPESVSRRL